jgi:DNA invertase Pin-like site-specific DNA recombinase
VRLDRVERRKVMALAQARHIDLVLVTELSRWGRSTLDLLKAISLIWTPSGAIKSESPTNPLSPQ